MHAVTILMCLDIVILRPARFIRFRMKPKSNILFVGYVYTNMTVQQNVCTLTVYHIADPFCLLCVNNREKTPSITTKNVYYIREKFSYNMFRPKWAIVR